MSDENIKALAFCAKNGVSVVITKSKIQTPPAWHINGEHGIKYDVLISRGKENYCFDFWGSICNKHNECKPTAYDVLACITKHDVGSFENFCSDFGYEADSIKALKTYQAVLSEYQNISRVLGGSLSEAREID